MLFIFNKLLWNYTFVLCKKIKYGLIKKCGTLYTIHNEIRSIWFH